jgi:hypothetical protein
MRLFKFFKKAEKETESILATELIPQVCLTEIPTEISCEIDKINWADFETAYGSAKMTIPFYLKNLFCTDKEISMYSTHQLWCSLCHQHAFISSASLPAYDILKIGLIKLDDNHKIELLDIFQGFADCTSGKNFAAIKQKPNNWEQMLRQKLLVDIELFRELANHKNEEISHFATTIYDGLMSAN